MEKRMYYHFRKKTHFLIIFCLIILTAYSEINLNGFALKLNVIVNTSTNNMNIRTKWSQPYNISNLDSYNCDSPYVALDSNENTHIVWSEEGYDSWREICHKMYDNNHKKWLSTEVISNLTDGVGSYYPIIKVDQEDNLHIVWRVSGTPGKVCYRYTSNGNWSEIITIALCNQTVFSHDLTFLSNSRIFFIWGNDFDLYYNCYNYKKKEWIHTEQLTNNTQSSIHPKATSDKNDVIHLTWGDGSDILAKSEIHYQQLVSDSWTLKERYIISSIDDIRSSSPEILMDNNDIVNIIWSDEETTQNRLYFGEIQNNIVINKIRLNNENLALFHAFFIDKKNNKHFVWLDGENYRYRVQTCNREWAEEIVIEHHQNLVLTNDLRIIVDSKNNINIFFSKFNGDSWELYCIAGKIIYNFRTTLQLYLMELILVLSFKFVIFCIILKRRLKK